MCIKATVFCVILFSFLVIEVKCSKILGFFHFPSVSHHLVYQQVYKELSLRGHDVVVVTPNPLNDPTLTNLTEIDISYIYKEKPNGGITLDYQGFYMDFYYEYGYKVAEMVLQDPRVTSLCSSDSTTFDVALVESYYPIWYKFGARCKAHLIAFSSADSMMSVHNALGNPLHPAYFGGFMLDYTNPLSIWKKIEYTYYFVWYNWFHQKYVLASSDYLIDKYINESLPKTEELEKNVSLLLVNTNLVICPIQPLVPSTIMLGFMHIKKSTSPSQIPKDLQTILDEAKHGVVYFSLGSNVKSSGLPSNTVGIIKAALSELPFTVLWKWETDDTPDVGRNVVTRKWFPQQDILAHPNVKAFLTQGGLQSTEEAIIYAVPMVGIPFFCDQEMNVRKGEKLGISIYLDKTTLTKENLKRAVLEIVQNKKYQKKIKELQKIAKDQPMTGLERAVWWTEYVIRHKGAKHLRSPAADISLFEYLLLDVILVVLSVLSLTSFVLYKVIRILLRLFSRKMRSKVKQS